MSENVYLFIPNIIGYARVVFAFIAFYYMPTHPFLASFLYLLSGLLDAFDGHAARYFKQATKFGAVLDMLTDRCATTCLLMVLGLFYPKYMIVFQFLVTLDLVSHWAQMYSSMMKGSSSHKSVSETDHPVLKLYYTSRTVLFVMCSGNELFFAMLYVLYFTNGPVIAGVVGLWKLILWISFPICAIKNLINVIQLIGAFQIIAAQDIIDRKKP